MARDADIIQREIEQAREALAATIDELGTRASPKRAVTTVKSGLNAKLADPKIRYSLIGVGAFIVLLLVRKLFR